MTCCALEIAKIVTAVEHRPEDALVIRLTDDSSISVSLRPEDYLPRGVLCSWVRPQPKDRRLTTRSSEQRLAVGSFLYSELAFASLCR